MSVSKKPPGVGLKKVPVPRLRVTAQLGHKGAESRGPVNAHTVARGSVPQSVLASSPAGSSCSGHMVPEKGGLGTGEFHFSAKVCLLCLL